jgi:hypothetical protein
MTAPPVHHANQHGDRRQLHFPSPASVVAESGISLRG